MSERYEKGFFGGEKKSHSTFEKYQQLIVEHPNYASLPNKFNSLGKITWVKVKDSSRSLWWDGLKAEMELADRAGVARAIHPKELGGFKPCQVCGKKLSIHYVYPSAPALAKLNVALAPLSFEHFGEEISAIVAIAFEEQGSAGLEKIAMCFSYGQAFSGTEELIKGLQLAGRNLSPGAMSNAPDRLDGFHTYNGCCRAKADTGRHRTNLARYSSDRRAYENWADGNWRAADRLMGEFRKQVASSSCPSCGKHAKMTADHIGPISLGFMHRMEFQPLCKACNSAKNNRFTLMDFEKLKITEAQNEEVVSWHTRPIWNSLKPLIRDDTTAIRASALMRRNLHHVLIILGMINDVGHRDFLTENYLHPEYAHFEYTFRDFDPSSGSFKFERSEVVSANTRKQAERYVKISLEALSEYSLKKNRNLSKWESVTCDALVSQAISQINGSSRAEVHSTLLRALQALADQAAFDF